jgi:hypothetical protein
LFNAQSCPSDCSAGALLKGRDGIQVKARPLAEMVFSSWQRFLTADAKKHEQTGRPVRENEFVETLQALLDRKLKRRTPASKKNDK